MPEPGNVDPSNGYQVMSAAVAVARSVGTKSKMIITTLGAVKARSSVRCQRKF